MHWRGEPGFLSRNCASVATRSPASGCSRSSGRRGCEHATRSIDSARVSSRRVVRAAAPQEKAKESPRVGRSSDESVTVASSPVRVITNKRSDAVLLLQAFVIALFVIPSDTVIKPIGAVGYPASLIGVFVFVVYCASVLFGLHQPVPHPIRGILYVIWVALLSAYIAMDRGRLTVIELASADRMVIRFMVVTGVALVAAECLHSVEDVMRVVRALCWAAAFCGFVAVLQYWLRLDLAVYLRQIP